MYKRSAIWNKVAHKKEWARLGQNYFCEKSSPTFVYFYKDIEKYTPTTEQKSS